MKTEGEARREEDVMEGEPKVTEDTKDPEDSEDPEDTKESEEPKEEVLRHMDHVRLIFSLLFWANLLGLFFVWQLLRNSPTV